jgi:hypothetical protein
MSSFLRDKAGCKENFWKLLFKNDGFIQERFGGHNTNETMY